MEQRIIGSGDWYLEFSFQQFKIIRLHAILHDAAGAERAHSGKGPGYCHMIGPGPISCLLGLVTGLLICLYVKLLLPSILDSVDNWSHMSCIVLEVAIVDINVIKRYGVFKDGNVQGYQIRPPKKYKPRKQALLCTRNLHGIVWKSGRLD